MKLKQENINGWKAQIWESGDLAIALLPQLGGRIISLKYCDQEHFFTQDKHAGETFRSYHLAGDKKRFGFRYWGGDKTWIAPERLWVDKIPPLDLDAGRYQFLWDSKAQRVVMASPVCRETGLRITREILFQDDRELTLVETIKNEGQKPLQRGIWNVTQILRPFEVYLQCAFNEVRLYEDEAFRKCKIDYYVSSAGPFTCISCRNVELFKFGAFLEKGRVLLLRRMDKSIFALNKSFAIFPFASYGHYANAEVYNSSAYPYGEIEIHSPIITLAPSMAFSHSQQWKMGSFSSDQSVEQIAQSI